MLSIRKTILLAAVPILLAACASSPPTVSDENEADGEAGQSDEIDYNFEHVLDEVDGLDEDERWERLVELAEAEEGTFMVYLSVGADDADALMADFETTVGSDQIDIDYWRAGGSTITQRIVQEHDAGRPQNDIVFQSASSLDRLDRLDLLQSFDTPLREQMVEGAQAEYGIGGYINVSVAMWNTDLVDGATEFETWLDVVRHDGVIGVELEGEIPFANLAWLFEEEYDMPMEETVQLFENATLSPVEGLTALAEFTAAGQADVAIGPYSHHFVGRLEDAPVEFRGGPEPFFFRWNGPAPMVTSEMPATSLLFIDYVASASGGQQMMREFGREPANANVESATPEIYDYEWRPFDDIRVNDERDMLAELWYDRILGQAPPDE